MKYNRILTILLIIIVSFSLAGCNRNDNAGTPIYEAFDEDNSQKEYEPEYGGKLILPLTNFTTLNPLMCESISYYHFSKLIFESLFELDRNFQIENQLAEDYTMYSDGTIKIKLKENVLWHDGQELTAEDVAFTINVIKYAENDSIYKKLWNSVLGAFPSNNNNIIDVNIIDKYNLEIKFEKVFSNSLEALIFPIIPKHRFVADREDKNSYINALDEENYTPIGTGPYKFIDYDRFKEVQLEYFEDYREGRPYIDSIVGKVLDDNDLAVTAFEVGQIDLTMVQGVDWEKFKQHNRVKVLEFISQDYEFLGFNFSNPLFGGEKGSILRKAIAYGIDRQAIIQKVFLGHATQNDLPIHPDSWLLSDLANSYGYNFTMAREELNKMGWKDIDGDGYYEDEEGKDISFRLLTNSYNPLRLKTADLIVEDLNKLGIHVIKDYVDKIPDNLTEEMVENQWQDIETKIQKGDYDIVLLGWTLSPVTELSFAFHTNGINSGTNFIRYTDETMDRLLESAFNSSTMGIKLTNYEILQSHIIKELPYVSLFFRNNALLLDRKIMGDIDPAFHNLYRNIEKWYIPKEFQEETVDKN